MHPKNKETLKNRVIQAAETALQRQNYVSAIDVFQGVGVLTPDSVIEWKKGELPYLERAIRLNLKKISLSMKFFRIWAQEKGLYPSQTGYLSKSVSERHRLIFSKSASPNIEKSYRTHFVLPELKEKQKPKPNIWLYRVDSITIWPLHPPFTFRQESGYTLKEKT